MRLATMARRPMERPSVRPDLAAVFAALCDLMVEHDEWCLTVDAGGFSFRMVRELERLGAPRPAGVRE